MYIPDIPTFFSRFSKLLNKISSLNVKIRNAIGKSVTLGNQSRKSGRKVVDSRKNQKNKTHIIVKPIEILSSKSKNRLGDGTIFYSACIRKYVTRMFSPVDLFIFVLKSDICVSIYCTQESIEYIEMNICPSE